MFLKAWNMSDGTVVIHEATCKHRKPSRTGRPPQMQDQVDDGSQEWLSKEAYGFDYWNNGILEEYEAEHGKGSFDVFQSMDFKPCCDELPLHEPKLGKKKGKKAAAEPRVTGHRQWAAKPVPRAMLQFSTWIEREFPDVVGKNVDPRLVMIASKAYGHFQKSDLNVPD
jgi:hypothetical protein